jgi:hypothetical protein
VQSDGVYWVTAIFMFLLPGLAGLLAIPAARRAVITHEQLDAIVSGVAALKADPHAEVPDPIVGGKVQRSSNAPLAVLTDHFTTAEWARYAQGPNPNPSSSPAPTLTLTLIPNPNPNPNPTRSPMPIPIPNPNPHQVRAGRRRRGHAQAAHLPRRPAGRVAAALLWLRRRRRRGRRARLARGQRVAAAGARAPTRPALDLHAKRPWQPSPSPGPGNPHPHPTPTPAPPRQVTGILLVLFVVGVPLDVLRFRAAGGGVEGIAASMSVKPLRSASEGASSRCSGSSESSDASARGL